MIRHITGNTSIDTFLQGWETILAEPEPLVIRDMKVLEIAPAIITVADPVSRCYFVKRRNDNIFAKVAETLWMLAGRDDIGWLSHYLPRVFDYSDNGRTWRGAYGPRLRNWNGHTHKVDQLRNVINTLHKDRYSRQAVISIWDPSEDMVDVTKDRPCNQWLQFIIRDEMLHMNVVQRSCDAMWGYSGIDTFSWSVLQQMMA